MIYLKSFIVGGLICALAQILIDKTKINSSIILVLFVCLGSILGSVGIYEKIIKFGGSGASVPLPGFGYLLYKGVIADINSKGLIGIFTGGLTASAAGICSAIIFSYIASIFFSAKTK